MTVVSLEIIEEFLRSPDPQLRKNGLTALSVIGRTDTIDRLVEASFADTDPMVRARAESEMAHLQGDAASCAAEAIVRHLADPRREMAAYGLLSRLVRTGWVPAIPGSWWQRAGRALRLVRSSPWLSAAKVRAIVVGLFGGACFSLVVWAFAVAASRLWPAVDEALAMTLLALLLGAFVAALVFARHVPLHEQADTAAAAAVGLLQTAVITAVVGLVLLLLVVVNTSPSGDVLVSWFKVLGTAVAAAVAARFGADLAGGQFHGPWRRLAMAGTGSVLGAAVTIVGLLMSGATSGDPYVAEGPNMYFLPIVISAAVIACAVAAFESRPPVTLPFGRGVANIGLTIVGLSVAVGLALAVRGVQVPTEDFVKDATRIESAPRDRSVQQRIESALASHARIVFTVDFDQPVRISTENPGDKDLELQLFDAGTGGLVQRVDDPDPPKFTGTLEKGTYLVEVGRYNTFGGSSGGFLKLPETEILRATFGARTAPARIVNTSAPDEPGRFFVTVVLNAQPED